MSYKEPIIRAQAPVYFVVIQSEQGFDTKGREEREPELLKCVPEANYLEICQQRNEAITELKRLKTASLRAIVNDGIEKLRKF